MASCTTCTARDGHVYCTGGCQAELCQTTGNSCLFSGSRDCCGGGCFLATTRILTARGLIPIFALREGDTVLTQDEAGMLVEARVTRTYKSVSFDGYYRINGDLGVTGEHPFKVGGRWVPAKDLRIGDVLTASDGSSVRIKSLIKINKAVRVYNIDTSGPNTFCAGGLLVHNKDGQVQG